MWRYIQTFLLLSSASFNPKFPFRLGHFVEALPINNSDSSKCSGGKLNPSAFCPELFSLSTNDRNLPNCLPNAGSLCPERFRVLGVSFFKDFPQKLTGLEKGATCTNYFLRIDSSLKEKVLKSCVTSNMNLQLLISTNINSSVCKLTTQLYNQSKANSNNNCEKISLSSASFPSCLQFLYNCSEETQIMKKLEAKGPLILAGKKGSTTPPPFFSKEASPLTSRNSKLSHSENDSRKNESIRRVKKPGEWSWMDHILELIVVAVVAIGLLLIAFKICLVEKLKTVYLQHHPTVVRFEDVRMPSLQEEVTSPPRSINIDISKPPSKPILKNKNNYHHNGHLHHSKRSGSSSGDKKRTASNGSHPPITKSFDSNSSNSIYYDALEGSSPSPTNEERDEHCEPLISSQEL